MNKLFIFAVALMLLLSLSSFAIAKSQHNNIILNRIVIIEDSPVVTSLVIKNNNDFDFDNGKVVVSIPQLGLRESKRVDINKGGKKTVRVLLEDVPKGDYYVRMVVSNKDGKRVRHRLITI